MGIFGISKVSLRTKKDSEWGRYTQVMIGWWAPYVRFFFFLGGGREVYYEKFAEWLFLSKPKAKLPELPVNLKHPPTASLKKYAHTDSIRIIHHQTPDGTALMNFASPSCEKKNIVFVVSRPVTQRAGRGKHEDLLGSWGRGVAQCQTITYLFPPSEDWAWFDGTKPLPAPGDRVPPGISFCTFVASHMLLRQPSPAYFPSHPVVSRRHAILALPFPHFSQAASSSFFPHAVAGPYILVQLISHYLAWLDENPQASEILFWKMNDELSFWMMAFIALSTFLDVNLPPNRQTTMSSWAFSVLKRHSF